MKSIILMTFALVHVQLLDAAPVGVSSKYDKLLLYILMTVSNTENISVVPDR